MTQTVGIPLDASYYAMLDRLPPVRYVVSFSTGASSAITAIRAIERYGRDQVDVVFMDTRWEDDDNYRFMRDVEDYLGFRFTVLADGRTPLMVASDRGIIPNQKIAPCTYELKIVQFVSYLKMLQREGYRPVALLGMSWHERKRMIAPRKNYAEIGVWADYPLTWLPMIGDPLAELKRHGLKPPRMYAMGYKHANCGGRCVKQGAADWRRTLKYFPGRFEESAEWEAQMQRSAAKFADYAFLRDSTGGTVRAKSLKRLQVEVMTLTTDQARLFELEDDLDFGCSVECGVGDHA